MVRCNDGTYYTGITNDLEKRLKAHNDGSGAKYTMPRRPVKLVYCETYPDRSEATQREIQLKKFTKAQKEILISDGDA